MSRRTTRSVSPRPVVVAWLSILCPHRAALHRDDRVVSVAAMRCGGEARYVARGRGPQDLFDRDGGNVVHFDHDMAVLAEHVMGSSSQRARLCTIAMSTRPAVGVCFPAPIAHRPGRVEIKELDQASCAHCSASG